jgi:oligopeptide transport system ATP-binding protein
VELPTGETVKTIFDRRLARQEPVASGGGDAIMEVNDLTMYFPVTKGLFNRRVGWVKAVDGVSFSIAPGHTLGIVGESGSGKSTVGHCVIGDYDITSGDVRYNGTQLATLGKEELRKLRREVQLITQDPFSSLDPRMTVKEAILEGVTVHGLIKSRTEASQRVEDMMELVGLNPSFASRFPHEFSGGQRQRISIARALALRPAFIVCDEVVSALDVSIQAQIIGLLMQIQKELGLTYIFIGHDLSVIRHISDDVAVMYLGKIVEMTKSDHLYDKPLHPYTQALISAVPIPNPTVDKQRERIILTGETPSPINPPRGCGFSTRCRYVTRECEEFAPDLVDVDNGHLVACHRISQGGIARSHD